MDLDYKKISTILLIAFLTLGELMAQNANLNACLDRMSRDSILLSERKQGKHVYKDNTLFFSLVALYGIEQYEADLSAKEQVKFREAKKAVLASIPKYKNITGRPTINFWRTNPNNQWPGKRSWHENKQRHIPDDFDDNVYWRLLEKDNTLDNILCNLLEQKRNGAEYWAKNLPDSIKKYPVYGTWIGKNMPIEIDIVVLSNILVYKSTLNQPFTKTDSLSLAYISKVYKSARKWRHGKVYSPQYARYSTILYHLVRLKQAIPTWQTSTDELLAELRSIDLAEMDLVEQCIIGSSIYKLGGKLETKIETKSFNGKSNYAFFYANAGSVFPKPLNRTIASIPAYFMPYYCEGLNYYLVWEFEYWHKKRTL